MNELSEVFSGAKPLSRVQKNGKFLEFCIHFGNIFIYLPLDKLRAWFTDIRDQIDQLTFDDVLSVGRKLVQLMRSLEEVRKKLFKFSFYDSSFLILGPRILQLGCECPNQTILSGRSSSHASIASHFMYEGGYVGSNTNHLRRVIRMGNN